MAEKESTILHMTDEIRDKLANLESHLPGEPSEVYVFADFLAKDLPKQYNARGWDFLLKRIISDCQDDFVSSGDADNPYPKEELRGAVNILKPSIMKIAESVLPNYFVEELKELYEV